MSPRPQSDSNERPDLSDAALGDVVDDSPSKASTPEVDADAAKLAEQLADASERYVRLQAEFDNYRKRSLRDREEDRRYACVPLMNDLVQVADNIDRAIEAAEKSKDIEGLLAGVNMVAEQLKTALANHHCVKIDAVGQPFDPNWHEAIAQQPSGDHEAQTVLQETQAGYRVHERVLRPSQVIVSRLPDDSE